MRFCEPINATQFIAREPHGSDDFVRITQEGIFNASIEMPFYYEPHNVLISPELIPSLVSDLIDWVDQQIFLLENASTLQHAAFSKGYLLSLVRALGYIHGSNKSRFSADGSRYLRMHNAMAAISIHRYCFGVLEKLAGDLQFEVSKRTAIIKNLAKGFLKMISGWTSFMEVSIPNALKVSLFIS